MKLTNTLVIVVLSTFAAISASANSNSKYAPLPSDRPADFVRVTRLDANPSKPSHSVLIASHIGGPVANQVLAAIATRTVPVVAVAR